MNKKYHWLLFLILGIIFVFIGCSKEKEPEVKESFDSIAEKGGSEIELPEGAKLIENPKDFKPVALDQSYQIEEDSNIYCSSPEMTTDGTNAYIYNGMHIKILDAESKTCQYLCSNPQCSHFGEECSAYFADVQGIQYYKGALYTLAYEEVVEGDIPTTQKVILYRISMDGVTRDKVCELATINIGDLVTLEDGNGFSCSMYWTIHRGYIYYVYDIGTSGMPDNTYYNNMSNYICRMKLEEGADREYIMPLEKGSTTEDTWLFGSGSYIYFCDMMGGKGILYRFNTEANEIEKLPLSERSVGDYIIGEDYLCYTEEGDSGVYKYHFSDHSTEKIIDCSEYDENYKTADTMGIFRDNQYLYVSNMIDEETYLIRCLVFDFEGNYISAFDLRAGEENTYVGIRIIGDKSALLTAGVNGYYYFDKEEIKTGKIQPVQVSDSTITK